MKLKIEEIPHSGFHLKKVLDADSLMGISRDNRGVGFTFDAPISLDLKVAKSKRDVFIHGRIATRLIMKCSRCLGKFDYPLISNFECIFSPSEYRSTTEDLELEIQDLGLSFYQDEEIDISEVVLEQIILDIPFKSLCHDNCRGLCNECGKDLNREMCECSHKDVFNKGFSKLRDFKVESRK